MEYSSTCEMLNRKYITLKILSSYDSYTLTSVPQLDNGLSLGFPLLRSRLQLGHKRPPVDDHPAASTEWQYMLWVHTPDKHSQIPF